MTADVKFTINALDIFNQYEPLNLGQEICWAVYDMATDNALGDVTSEFILDTYYHSGADIMSLLDYIDYDEEDLYVSDARAYRGSTNAEIVFGIPVVINA